MNFFKKRVKSPPPPRTGAAEGAWKQQTRVVNQTSTAQDEAGAGKVAEPAKALGSGGKISSTQSLSTAGGSWNVAPAAGPPQPRPPPPQRPSPPRVPSPPRTPAAPAPSSSSATDAVGEMDALVDLLDLIGLGAFLGPFVARGCNSVAAAAELKADELVAAGLKPAQMAKFQRATAAHVRAKKVAAARPTPPAPRPRSKSPGAQPISGVVVERGRPPPAPRPRSRSPGARPVCGVGMAERGRLEPGHGGSPTAAGGGGPPPPLAPPPPPPPLRSKSPRAVGGGHRSHSPPGPRPSSAPRSRSPGGGGGGGRDSAGPRPSTGGNPQQRSLSPASQRPPPPLLGGTPAASAAAAKDQAKSFLDSDGEDEDEPGGFTPRPAALAVAAPVTVAPPTSAKDQAKSFLDSDGEDEDEPGGFTPRPAALAVAAPVAAAPPTSAKGQAKSFLDSDGEDQDDDKPAAPPPPYPPPVPSCHAPPPVPAAPSASMALVDRMKGFLDSDDERSSEDKPPSLERPPSAGPDPKLAAYKFGDAKGGWSAAKPAKPPSTKLSMTGPASPLPPKKPVVVGAAEAAAVAAAGEAAGEAAGAAAVEAEQEFVGSNRGSLPLRASGASRPKPKLERDAPNLRALSMADLTEGGGGGGSGSGGAVGATTLSGKGRSPPKKRPAAVNSLALWAPKHRGRSPPQEPPGVSPPRQLDPAVGAVVAGKNQFNAAAGQELFRNLFRKRKAAPAATAAESPVDGFMLKLSRRGNWQRRWFAFRSPSMIYWKAQPATPDEQPDAVIDLRRLKKLVIDSDLVMVLEFSSRTYTIKVANKNQLKAWAGTVKRTLADEKLKKAASRKAALRNSQDSESRASGGGGAVQKRGSITKRGGGASGGGSGDSSGDEYGGGGGGPKSNQLDSSDEEDGDALMNSDKLLAKAQEAAKRKFLAGVLSRDEYVFITSQNTTLSKSRSSESLGSNDGAGQRGSFERQQCGSFEGKERGSFEKQRAFTKQKTMSFEEPKKLVEEKKRDQERKDSKMSASAAFGLFSSSSFHRATLPKRKEEKRPPPPLPGPAASNDGQLSLGLALAEVQASAKRKFEKGIITGAEYKAIIKQNKALFAATAEKGAVMPKQGIVWGGEEESKATSRQDLKHEVNAFLDNDDDDDDALAAKAAQHRYPIPRSGARTPKELVEVSSFLGSDDDEDVGGGGGSSSDGRAMGRVTGRPPQQPSLPVGAPPRIRSALKMSTEVVRADGTSGHASVTPAITPVKALAAGKAKVASFLDGSDDDDSDEAATEPKVAPKIGAGGGRPMHQHTVSQAKNAGTGKDKVASFLDTNDDEGSDDDVAAAATSKTKMVPMSTAHIKMPPKKKGGLASAHLAGVGDTEVDDSDVDESESEDSESSGDGGEDDDGDAEDFLAGGADNEEDAAAEAGVLGGPGGGEAASFTIVKSKRSKGGTSGSAAVEVPPDFAGYERLYAAFASMDKLRFTLLPLEARMAMVKSAAVRTVPLGEDVMTQGAERASFFVVIGPDDDSEVVATVASAELGVEREIAHLGYGCYFGERALVNPPASLNYEARTSTVRPFTSAVDVAEITSEHFEAWQPLRLALILSDVPLLQKLPKIHRDAMQEKLKFSHFDPGTCLFNQGDEGDRFYMIIRGEVAIQDDFNGPPPALPRVLVTLGEGHCFGEMALVFDTPRNATAQVVCKYPAEIAYLEREDFRAGMSSQEFQDIVNDIIIMREAKKEIRDVMDKRKQQRMGKPISGAMVIGGSSGAQGATPLTPQNLSQRTHSPAASIDVGASGDMEEYDGAAGLQLLRERAHGFAVSFNEQEKGGGSGGGGGGGGDGKGRESAEIVRLVNRHKDPETGQPMFNEYVRVGKLGKGSYGEVHRVEDTRDGIEYALKILDSKKSNAASIAKEIAVLKRLKHRNLVNLREVLDDPKNSKVYLVMELVEKGELIGDVVEVKDPFSNAVARRYFRDIICGLAYLHVHGVIHCDLKPQNLFVTHDDRIKIADFGSATFDEMRSREEDKRNAGHGSDGNSQSGGSLWSAANGGSGVVKGNMAEQAALGTPLFMAPELFKCSADEDEGPKFVQPSVDIWSLGATLFMMVCGRPPWMGRNELELSHRIQHIALSFPSPEDLDPHLMALIRKMLVKEPEERIGLHEIFESDWVTCEGIDPVNLVADDFGEAGGRDSEDFGSFDDGDDCFYSDSDGGGSHDGYYDNDDENEDDENESVWQAVALANAAANAAASASAAAARVAEAELAELEALLKRSVPLTVAETLRVQQLMKSVARGQTTSGGAAGGEGGPSVAAIAASANAASQAAEASRSAMARAAAARAAAELEAAQEAKGGASALRGFGNRWRDSAADDGAQVAAGGADGGVSGAVSHAWANKGFSFRETLGFAKPSESRSGGAGSFTLPPSSSGASGPDQSSGHSVSFPGPSSPSLGTGAGVAPGGGGLGGVGGRAAGRSSPQGGGHKFEDPDASGHGSGRSHGARRASTGGCSRGRSPGPDSRGRSPGPHSRASHAGGGGDGGHARSQSKGRKETVLETIGGGAYTASLFSGQGAAGAAAPATRARSQSRPRAFARERGAHAASAEDDDRGRGGRCRSQSRGRASTADNRDRDRGGGRSGRSQSRGRAASRAAVPAAMDLTGVTDGFRDEALERLQHDTRQSRRFSNQMDEAAQYHEVSILTSPKAQPQPERELSLAFDETLGTASLTEGQTFEQKRNLRKSTENFTFMAASMVQLSDDEGEDDYGFTGGDEEASVARSLVSERSGGGGGGVFATRGVLKVAARDGISNFKTSGTRGGGAEGATAADLMGSDSDGCDSEDESDEDDYDVGPLPAVSPTSGGIIDDGVMDFLNETISSASKNSGRGRRGGGDGSDEDEDLEFGDPQFRPLSDFENPWLPPGAPGGGDGGGAAARRRKTLPHLSQGSMRSDDGGGGGGGERSNRAYSMPAVPRQLVLANTPGTHKLSISPKPPGSSGSGGSGDDDGPGGSGGGIRDSFFSGGLTPAQRREVRSASVSGNGPPAPLPMAGLEPPCVSLGGGGDGGRNRSTSTVAFAVSPTIDREDDEDEYEAVSNGPGSSLSTATGMTPLGVTPSSSAAFLSAHGPSTPSTPSGSGGGGGGKVINPVQVRNWGAQRNLETTHVRFGFKADQGPCKYQEDRIVTIADLAAPLGTPAVPAAPPAAPPLPAPLRSGSACSRGADAFGASAAPCVPAPGSGAELARAACNRGSFFGVFDGHGGSEVADMLQESLASAVRGRLEAVAKDPAHATFVPARQASDAAAAAAAGTAAALSPPPPPPPPPEPLDQYLLYLPPRAVGTIGRDSSDSEHSGGAAYDADGAFDDGDGGDDQIGSEGDEASAAAGVGPSPRAWQALTTALSTAFTATDAAVVAAERRRMADERRRKSLAASRSAGSTAIGLLLFSAPNPPPAPNPPLDGGGGGGGGGGGRDPQEAPLLDANLAQDSAASAIATAAAAAAAGSAGGSPHGSALWLVVANVGDCRAVLSRGGAAMTLSHDHKVTDARERARIAKLGLSAQVRDGRLFGVLAVSRSFGDVALKTRQTKALSELAAASASTGSVASVAAAVAEEEEGEDADGAAGPNAKEALIAAPEIVRVRVRPTDEFVVVASDGVWDELSSQKVVNFVRRRLAAHKCAQRAARELVSEALGAGGHDNTSALIIVLHQTA